jgi:hypothetical protein
LDLPCRRFELVYHQRSLYIRSRSLPPLSSPRQGRGRRPRGRRSPCHLLRAQCWSLLADASVLCIHRCPIRTLSLSGSSFDLLQLSRYLSSLSMAFAGHTQSTAACEPGFLNVYSLSDGFTAFQILVRHFVDGLCNRAVHLISYHHFGMSPYVRSLYTDSNLPIDILSALCDHRKRLPAPRGLHDYCWVNALSLRNSRAYAGTNTDAITHPWLSQVVDA